MSTLQNMIYSQRKKNAAAYLMDLYLETYELDLNFKFALINKRQVYWRYDVIILLSDYVHF